MEHVYSHTGDHVEVPGHVDKIPEFDPRSGAHLWVMIATWKCDPEKLIKQQQEGLLDHENLLALGGPGCYFCEKAYSSALSLRRCKGHY